MQNPGKVLLATAVLMVLHASPGWSDSSLNQKQNENKNEIIKLKEKIEKPLPHDCVLNHAKDLIQKICR